MPNLDGIGTERARTLLRIQAQAQQRIAINHQARGADALALSHELTGRRLEQLLAAADRVWADADRLESLAANAAVDPETEACRVH